MRPLENDMIESNDWLTISLKATENKSSTTPASISATKQSSAKTLMLGFKQK